MNEEIRQELSSELRLENRVKSLEHRLETIWRELFYAYTIDVRTHQGRTTLKGVLDRLCEQTGIELVRSPWGFSLPPDNLIEKEQ